MSPLHLEAGLSESIQKKPAICHLILVPNDRMKWSTLRQDR